MAKISKASVKKTIKLAEAGDGLAQYYVANFYRYGLADGVSIDHATAFEWAMKSAENGTKEAMTMVGDSLIWGKGVAPDESKGLKMLRKAHSLGCGEAAFMLVQHYKNAS